ncbi:DUF402 domain-containing protein [Streptomyces cinerochromogenes]|uniref:DUF402 domain-containing protein n=1 Tax=Streptomyces cinerochromogenes TaxID=66422 RepID=A0ABW7BC79_9ACTN
MVHPPDVLNYAALCFRTAMTERFSPGQVIVRRELLDGKPWITYPVRVVEDSDELLAVYLAQGTPMTFGSGPFSWGPHPWQAIADTWQSPGVLQLQRPGDLYAVWVFWSDDRSRHDWYVNFQRPFRRTTHGIDTLDLELDIRVPGDGGPYRWKDVDHFESRAQAGGFAAGEADRVREAARELTRALDRGETWWDPAWSQWRPEASWTVPERVPLTVAESARPAEAARN